MLLPAAVEVDIVLESGRLMPGRMLMALTMRERLDPATQLRSWVVRCGMSWAQSESGVAFSEAATAEDVTHWGYRFVEVARVCKCVG